MPRTPAEVLLRRETPVEVESGADGPPTPSVAQLGEADLAELLTAFNAVTARVQRSHDALTEEVAQLQSELGQANEQLRRSERLAAIGHMAAGIAHEIRNPLASIQLYGEILQKDLAGDESLQPLASKICAAVRGLDAIVRDVLTFAREIKVRPTELGVAETLAGSLADCRGLLEETKVTVAPLQVVPTGCSVVADASLLRVVFSNIIRNAAEAMSEMPDAADRQRLLEVRAEHEQTSQGERAIVVRFLDRGPGVSPEVRERLCNPFFTTRAAGTGLGLAIVHRILEAHGAALDVRSRADDLGGAEFIITLPKDGELSRDVETHG